ncbi:TonB-dependent siderophore receptor [Motilimonas eburnea]|uniref:TonB-dependent siderophore receptor n=1 Tax=Motilimonas eburnea TaxID=1737488 RepID=UPI001E3007FF|nr:TonB-dependent siderophore receptor [Motilimonas eburnea]MCE2570297.1 TonB-dependent siderophore receptor [Motilimonas eburnea]
MKNAPSRSHNPSGLKKSTVGIAVGMAMTSMAYAQQQEVSVESEKMVVWGTKVSSNAESLLTQDMSLKQADHMSDLLRDVPGVDVGGTHSVNQRITIRGLNETRLDIRLDGASQHANMFHHIGNLTLNPDILKSAEIQVGNNSVTQSGLGGSVYFETKDARDLISYGEVFGSRIYGGYASNDSQQGSLTLYGLFSEQVDAMVYGQYVSRDDFKNGDGETTFGAAGDVYNVLGKLGYEISDLHRLELSYDIYRDSGDYSPRPDMFGGANTQLSKDQLIPTDYDRDTVTLNYELRGEQHKGKVTLYQSQTEIIRDESVITGRWPANRLSKNSAKNKNVGANAQFQSQLLLGAFNHTLTYGADYLDRTSSSKYGGQGFMKESAISTALFLEDKFDVTEHFYITAGLRYEDYQRKAVTGNKTFDELTWALAADWQVSEEWALYASSRSLFKGPDLLESFIAYQNVAYLDKNIKAETGLNSQAGIRFDKKIGKHVLSANISYFITDIDDYIVEQYMYDSTPAIYRIYNLGDVEIKGFEASVFYGFEQFNTKLSYAKSDAKDKTTGGPVPNGIGQSIDMGDSIALTLDYQADEIDSVFGWTSMVVLEEDNVFEGQPVKEGYDVHNLYAQWVPAHIEGLSLTFGIDNIFDETYTSHASRSGTARGVVVDDYEPGRNVKLSAAYQF